MINNPNQIFNNIHKIALGLLPLSLCFWYYQPIIRHPVEKVYFLYSDGVFFLSDALALVAVLAWLMARHCEKRSPAKKQSLIEDTRLLRWSTLAMTAFCLLASFSTFWAVDGQVALIVSLHLWLLLGLFVVVSHQPESWRALALGFCVALTGQIVMGGWQFFAQTTAFLAPLGLEWPGSIEPLMRGASVVELADGERLLRVYGSLPHPNLLGGFTLMFLCGPAAFFFAGGQKRQLWALALLTGGAALLILTFSRSAWVGLAAAGYVFLFQRRTLSGQRALAAGAALLAGLLTAAVPLHRFLFTRAGAGSVATESFSNAGRAWLTGQALNIIKDHPMLGVGVGNFMVEYAQRAPVGYLLEPVHSLPLLLVSELGIPGVLVGLGLAMVILRGIRQQNALFSALLIGLLVTSLFDHYLWTLAPGRMLLALAFGLFFHKQEKNDATHPL